MTHWVNNPAPVCGAGSAEWVQGATGQDCGSTMIRPNWEREADLVAPRPGITSEIWDTCPDNLGEFPDGVSQRPSYCGPVERSCDLTTPGALS